MPLSYFTVTGPLFEVAGASGPLPLSGMVTFTPCDTTGSVLSSVVSSALDATIALTPISTEFSGSLSGVQLVDNVDLNLADLVYQVVYTNVTANGVGVELDSFYFAAPGNGAAVDVNTVARLSL